jgi:pimeloyl-ACP methyl ester carboxylesterase
MRACVWWWSLACLVLGAAACAPRADAAPTGRWSGNCGPAGDRRALAVTIEARGGPLAGTLDLASAGLVDEPLSRLAAHGDSVVLVLATDLGDVAFAGARHGDRIEGRMLMGPLDVPFDLVPVAAEAPAWRVLDVTIPHGDVTLAGSWFVPAGPGPFPAVVFLHGSGDAARLGLGDRARVQAYLREGIAVLVYDKRGVGGSTGDYRRVGMRELADDGLAALDWLGGRTEVRRDARGFDGRSQGCWLAEMAAATPAHDVAFVVAQVGGGVAPWRQELYRVGAELRAAGADAATVDSARAWVRLHYAVAKGDSSWERYRQVAESLRGVPWLELKRPYASPEQARASWERLSSYEPAPDLARMRCPLLAVLGAEDRSTPTDETAQAFRRSVRPEGAATFEVRVLPGAGHELLELPPSGIPRSPAGYPELVARWVKGVVGAPH